MSQILRRFSLPIFLLIASNAALAADPKPSQALEQEVKTLVKQLEQEKSRDKAFGELMRLAVEQGEEKLLTLLPVKDPNPEVQSALEELREEITRMQQGMKEIVSMFSMPKAGALKPPEINETYALAAIRFLPGEAMFLDPANQPAFRSLVSEKEWKEMIESQGNGSSGPAGVAGKMVQFSLYGTRGIAHGYRFSVVLSAKKPKSACYLTAVPLERGVSGKKSFCMSLKAPDKNEIDKGDEESVVYESPSGAEPPVNFDPADGGSGKPGGDFKPCQTSLPQGQK